MLVPKSIEEILLKCINKNGKLIGSRFAKYKTQEIEDFMKKYNLTSRQLYYIWKNKLDEIPCCETCGKRLLHFEQSKHFCSLKCSNNNPKVQEKKNKSCLEHYGVEHPLQSNEIVDKWKQTNLQQYGYEFGFQSPEIRAKGKQTNLEKYGCEHALQSPEIQKKVVQTNLKRFGCERDAQAEEIKEKTKRTNQERYGRDWFMGSDDFKNKTKETFLKHYGVDHPWKSEEIREKIKQTNLEKYGYEYVSQSPEIKELYKQLCLERYGVDKIGKAKEVHDKGRLTVRKKMFDKFIETINQSEFKLISSKDEILSQKDFKIQHSCGEIIIVNTLDIDRYICPKCKYDDKSSQSEMEIISFIKSIYNDTIETHNREILGNNKEVDIYLPNLNLAIEYNGDFWHNVNRKGKYYHFMKSYLCHEKGIHLLHIFEHEWVNEKEKVKSIIKSKLGIFEHYIQAKDCTVKEISHSEYTNFISSYSFQSIETVQYQFGMFYGDILVAVIGWSDDTLYNYCMNYEYHIQDCLEYFLKYIINNFEIKQSIIDFAYDNYTEYIQNEFIINDFLEPSYKIINKDKNLMIESDMTENGSLQIYDSGKILLKYKI